MCEPDYIAESYKMEKSAEQELADLMFNNLGVIVNSKHLKCFIQLHWDKIAKHAHKIHDQL